MSSVYFGLNVLQHVLGLLAWWTIDHRKVKTLQKNIKKSRFPNAARLKRKKKSEMTWHPGNWRLSQKKLFSTPSERPLESATILQVLVKENNVFLISLLSPLNICFRCGFFFSLLLEEAKLRISYFVSFSLEPPLENMQTTKKVFTF